MVLKSLRKSFLLTTNLAWFALSQTGCMHAGPVLEGQVLDHQHRPVPSARVIVVNSAEGHIRYLNPEWIDYGSDASRYDNESLGSVHEHNGRYSARTRTDHKGRFRITGLGTDRYHLLAVHPEQGLSVVPNIQVAEANPPVRIDLKPPTLVIGKIEGYKRGKSGWWHGANENIYMVPGGERQDASFLNEDGKAVVNCSRPCFGIGRDGSFRAGPLTAGGLWQFMIDRTLHRRLSGARLLSLPIQVEEGKPIHWEVDLRRGVQLSGQILGPDGKPLPETGVEVQSLGGTDSQNSSDQSHRLYGAITDRAGKYTIEGLPEGKYTLRAARNSERPWDRRINPAHFCANIYQEFAYQREIEVTPASSRLDPIRIEKFADPPVTFDKYPARLKKGDKAPKVAGLTLQGETLDSSAFHGKVVLVDFWATWCSPCVAEMTYLRKAHQDYGMADRLALIGISVDESPDLAADFVRKNDMPWSQIALAAWEKPARESLLKAYGVNSLPTTVVIGADGKVLATDLRGEALQDYLSTLLGKTH